MSPVRAMGERLRAMVIGIRDAVLPTRSLPEPQEPPHEMAEDVHARGHRHVGPPPAGREPGGAGRPRARPWSRGFQRWGEVHHKARG